MEYKLDIETKFEVDVFVAGGGPAGVAAAVSCARCGKTVFIAEKSGCFGGMGTLGLVPEMMNFDNGKDFLAIGIGREIRDGLFGKCPNDRRTYIVKVEEVKKFYDDMILKSGAEFRFFTSLVDVISEDGVVKAAVLHSKSGFYAVKAKVFIDCTGDGDLCVMAGAEYEMGGESGVTMPATLCSMWGGINFDKRFGGDTYRLDEAIDDGVFSQSDKLLPGIFPIFWDAGIGGGNVGHCFGVDATDEKDLTNAMILGRKIIREYEYYYKNYLKGYENAVLCGTANVLGVRESRRIIGDYRLCLEDYINKADFEDEIGRYSYPIDIHIESPDEKSAEKFAELNSIRLKKGESFGIPYRALIPKRLKNVLVAGRCISSDRYIQSVVRVIPCCFITGQAAGIAAAMASKTGDVRIIDICLLKRQTGNNSPDGGNA